MRARLTDELYSSFKLLASDFVDGPLGRASGFRVIMALVCLLSGLGVMTVLGKWV